MKKIHPTPAHQDKRGGITDLLENEEINAITVISFARGAVRANHVHKLTTQWNYVLSGKIKLVTQTGSGPVLETLLEKGDLAETVPNESHALEAVEEAELMVFTKGPRGGKEYESDTYRLDKPLIPNS
jgi:quercetin dioxygenase-like cupin family protein